MTNPRQTDAFGLPKGTAKITISLPLTVLADLDRVARRMKVSRSALLSQLLAQPVAAMAEVVDEIPETGATASDVRRARGKSVALIEQAVGEAQALIEEPAPPRARRARRRARKPK